LGLPGEHLSKLVHLIGQWLRHAQRLFHMLVGLAFLILAGAGASVSLQEWNYYRQAPSVGLLHFGLLAGFTVLLFVFCLYSFVKARSVR
jgi:hypothetical protein